jgi:hypothetical protein
VNNSKPLGKTIVITSGGQVRILGVDFETNRLKIVAQNSESIVIRVPGRTCWDGNYSPRRYVSPEVMVYKILKSKKQPHGQTFEVEPLIEWTEKRNLKKKIGEKS